MRLLLYSIMQECAEDGWEVLGACGPDHQSSSGGGAEQRFTVPVETCHQYRLQRPTILVLGELAPLCHSAKHN